MERFIDLRGKNILITGASSGIGRESAILLSSLGARCILLSRNQAALEGTLSQLSSVEIIGEHRSYSYDLTDVSGIEQIAKKIYDENGALDGIVYSAGITEHRPISQFKIEEFDQVMHVNLAAFIELVKCTTKRGRYNDGLRIVAVSSVTAFNGSKAHLVYSASKAGLNSAVRCMAKELAKKGICVNAVAPGSIETSMYEVFKNDVAATNGTAYTERFSRQYLGLGQPADVANAIAFLISPASRLITGVCLPVDGGFVSA